jgi:hypothetical protein
MLLQKCNDSNLKCGRAVFSVDSGDLDIDDVESNHATNDERSLEPRRAKRLRVAPTCMS